MRLTRIQVRNFRLLRRVTVDLAKDTVATVLVGPNNSGKTSLMDAIRLLVQRGAEGRHRVQIHDFANSRRSAFALAQQRVEAAPDDESRIAALQRYLPIIRVTMTFEYGDTTADLNAATVLLMDLNPESNEVTVRIEFAVVNALKLWKAFQERRKPDETTLFDVLAKDLHAFYGLTYSKISPDGRKAERLEDGSIIGDLLRVDTISAQRHIDDEEAGKAARLSRLLHAHYTTYIREEDEEGYDAIEDAILESAKALTEKYGNAFGRLLNRLRDFGYPQGNARPDLKIKAEMSSATIYRDNTKIYYAAPAKTADAEEEPSYDLPERYNGLGYKNLIYLVLQLESFRAAIEAAPGDRPGVHLIGIEEPEVHLHPQMQAVFIKEISRTLTDDAGPTAQVVLTTHSPHMVADSGFSPIRYFRREQAEVEVRDLSQMPLAGETPQEETATLAFLRRYIKLTHCDLLFADKCVLVEGQVEKLLLPAMIEKVAREDGFTGFASQYVTVLEIGGAYAHRIDPFLRFIGIPTLVIADIDAARADRTKCRVAEGEITTNGVIGYWLPGRTKLADLLAASAQDKLVGSVRIAYQTPEGKHCGRSFEEAFLYANADWITEARDKFVGSKAAVDKAVEGGLLDSAYEFGMEVNKVDFALDLMTTEGWRVPLYIEEGLKWLALQERGN